VLRVNAQTLWDLSSETLRDLYYYECYLEKLVGRLNWTGTSASGLATITSAASGVAGWTLWSSEEGKVLWAVLSGAATVTAALATAMRVADQHKKYEQLRQEMAVLRGEVEEFRNSLRLGKPFAQAQSEYAQLTKRCIQCVAKISPTVFAVKLAGAAQDEAIRQLQNKGYMLREPS